MLCKIFLNRELRDKNLEELKALPRYIHTGFNIRFKNINEGNSYCGHEEDWVGECYLIFCPEEDKEYHANFIYFPPISWIEANLIKLDDSYLYFEMPDHFFAAYCESMLRDSLPLIKTMFEAGINSHRAVKEYINPLLEAIPEEYKSKIWQQQ